MALLRRRLLLAAVGRGRRVQRATTSIPSVVAATLLAPATPREHGSVRRPPAAVLRRQPRVRPGARAPPQSASHRAATLASELLVARARHRSGRAMPPMRATADGVAQAPAPRPLPVASAVLRRRLALTRRTTKRAGPRMPCATTMVTKATTAMATFAPCRWHRPATTPARGVRARRPCTLPGREAVVVAHSRTRSRRVLAPVVAPRTTRLLALHVALRTRRLLLDFHGVCAASTTLVVQVVPRAEVTTAAPLLAPVSYALRPPARRTMTLTCAACTLPSWMTSSVRCARALWRRLLSLLAA